MRAVTIGLALLVSFSFYQLAHRAAVALASQCFAPTVNRRNQRDRHWQLLPAMCALATSSYDALVPSSTRPSARARTEPNADTRWSWRRLCFWDVRLCLGGFAGRSYPSHPTPGSRSDVMAARRNGASESRPPASSAAGYRRTRFGACLQRAERHRRRRRVRTATARPDDAMGSRITACGSGLPRHTLHTIYVYILYMSCLPLLANAKAGLRWDIYTYIGTYIVYILYMYIYYRCLACRWSRMLKRVRPAHAPEYTRGVHRHVMQAPVRALQSLTLGAA